MEQNMLYTAVLHNRTEGYTVRYLGLPAGLDRARSKLTETLTDKGTLLTALIPGHHPVALPNGSHYTRDITWL